MSDTFISYAHVDNQPISENEKGWITHFVNNLRNEVGRKLGRIDSYQPWMDFKLQGNDAVTPEIKKQLGEAETFLLFLSPGWLASEWCQLELETFIQQNPDPSSRIFVIEQGQIDENNKPDSLNDLLTYRFWLKTDQDKIRQFAYPIPLPIHNDYYESISDVSNDLATLLQCLKRNNLEVSNENPAYKEVIYLAPVNDSLHKERTRLINELCQFGINCLPHNNTFDDNMEDVLEDCSHFVQLLDEQYTLGIPANQYFIANKTDKPIAQWRHNKLDINKANHQQRELLEGNKVIASNITDFARYLIDLILPKPEEEPIEANKSNGQKMIFIHAGQQDFNWAESIAETLANKGYGYALPRYTGDSGGIRKSIKRGLDSCNILLMLHQETPVDVVEDFLSEAHLHSTEKSDDYPLLVCQGCDAEKLGFHPPGMHLLNCNKDKFGENCLEKLLLEVEL